MCVRSLAYTLSEPTQGINISLTSVKHVLTITYSVQSMYKQILSTYIHRTIIFGIYSNCA